ncbi:MAG: hypothetical protein ACR2NN_28610 [Bryobacteraceae bacterium]
MSISPELYSKINEKAETMNIALDTTVVDLTRLGLEAENRREEELAT